MPYLNIQTNLPRPPKAGILKHASSLVATELGKPEEFVMVALEPGTPMLFAGSDGPAAFLELKSIGLPGGKTRKLSAALCALIEQHLGVPRERVYVKFSDVQHDMWGWNGDVF